jgi:hypothetical protein
VDEPLNDTKKITPSARVEQNDAGNEHLERAPVTPDTKTAEDAKSDAAIEDRFEATDN